MNLFKKILIQNKVGNLLNLTEIGIFSTTNATKNYLQAEILLHNKKNDVVSYRFNHLSYNRYAFSGNKHELKSKITLKKDFFLC